MNTRKMIAKKNFFLDNRAGSREMVYQGQPFETEAEHAHQLKIRGIAAAFPAETPEAGPTEQPIGPSGSETKETGPVETPGEVIKPIEEMEYKELKAAAKAAAIPGYNTMSKTKLIEELNNLKGGQ